MVPAVWVENPSSVGSVMQYEYYTQYSLEYYMLPVKLKFHQLGELCSKSLCSVIRSFETLRQLVGLCNMNIVHSIV